MFKIYFDGSGKSESEYLTLVGFAAEQEPWSIIEREWLRVCGVYRVPYMHMADAVQFIDPFDRWDWDILSAAVTDLTLSLNQAPHGSIRGFRCTVRMADYSKWRPIFHMPEVTRMCSRWTFDRAIRWYGSMPRAMLDKIDVVYDRGEPFLKHTYSDWKNRKNRPRKPLWDLVNSVASADWRLTPALQLADMLAWSANRVYVSPRHEKIDPLCNFVINAADTVNVLVDERVILDQYGSLHRPPSLRRSPDPVRDRILRK